MRAKLVHANDLQPTSVEDTQPIYTKLWMGTRHLGPVLA